MKKKIITVFMSVFLLVSTPILALAATINVGGGTWNYGTTFSTVYSEYKHKSKQSHTTVYGLNNKKSGWKKAGTWAKVSTVRKLSGNKAFWKTR